MGVKRLVQNTLIIVLGVAIIAMSVGYASFATPTLTSESPSIKNSSWDVHFANPSKLETSTVEDTAITGPTLTNDSTSLTFAVDLKNNQKYDFTIDVINSGTIPAKLTSFTFAGTKGDESIINASTGLSYTSDKLTYTVTYEDGTTLLANDELKAGSKKKIRISVSNIDTEENSANETYVFTLNLNYAQAK